MEKPSSASTETSNTELNIAGSSFSSDFDENRTVMFFPSCLLRQNQQVYSAGGLDMVSSTKTWYGMRHARAVNFINTELGLPCHVFH